MVPKASGTEHRVNSSEQQVSQECRILLGDLRYYKEKLVCLSLLSLQKMTSPLFLSWIKTRKKSLTPMELEMRLLEVQQTYLLTSRLLLSFT